ncbi:site-specific DNA-methyltransferase [Gramella sp. KN1008]|uniref:site-specific DNA-methyltransferase n=1 Tax=Gramella sp. KN1008 TaxID=2529298 RepID=UPI00103DC544|nr:site-specific DNA-methyltransferase [Gramella sp. KN1008]TBW28268.1 site-specific DNA-methyltransferase [Gramella sp. KN1008]
MPTLNWIGKDKIVNHHQEVPFKTLEHKYGFKAKEGKIEAETHSGNKIIHGDNLQALKSLLPQYEGKIKCIYIDPPYNTGNKTWVYNDNVSHPKINKWLGETVGKEGEDLSRDDKWLCMMYPRLKLLRKLLAEDGIIFISIDDYAYHNLLNICFEIFGKKNKIATTIWDLGTGTQAGHFVRSHEYVLAFAKNKDQVPNFKGGEGIIKHSALKKISKKNPASEFEFPIGTRFDAHDDVSLEESWGGSEKTTLIKGKMQASNGILKSPVTLRAGWAMKSQMENWFYNNPDETYDTKGQKVKEFYFNKNGVLTYIKEKSVTNPPTVLRELGSTKTGSKELTALIGDNKFDFPKPTELIKFLLKLVTRDGDIILDSFAGTGTTGQAVLSLNKEDGANRKFILVELEDYAENVTSGRIENSIRKYGFDEAKFDFCELGQSIFDENQNLNEEVGTNKIKEYIWYSETRTSFSQFEDDNSKEYLGTKDGTAYYFIYEPDNLTTLDYETLSKIKIKAEQYIVYADNCLLSKDFLTKHNIIFKKIPRDITRF